MADTPTRQGVYMLVCTDCVFERPSGSTADNDRSNINDVADHVEATGHVMTVRFREVVVPAPPASPSAHHLGAACPGPCNRQWRDKVASNPVTATQPIPGRPYWCDKCRTIVHRAYDALPELYVRLGVDTVNGALTTDTERVSGSTANASPSHNGDTQNELVSWLIEWEDAARALQDLPPADRAGREPTTLITAHAALRRDLDWLLDHPDYTETFGRAVLAWQRRLQRQTHTDRQQSRSRVPCPRCDYQTLARGDGHEHWSCSNCGRLLSMDEYDELATVYTGIVSEEVSA